MSRPGRTPRRRKPEIHVHRDRKGRDWLVVEGGRRLSAHRTQADAVRAGIQRAKRTRVDVVTHGVNGRIRSKDSYGNESPVRDTEH